ncbi:hypothetical protein GCM10022204_26430 [Microlunatus aurantiacus]|uniref:Uncharacterized protein n=1 Tax=Microlunatus aurantiacus TaxID=446786 RepID=A0ABP7DS06_9ACTN
MPSRPGVTVGLALGLPLILIFSMLVFLVLTEPEDCLPADLPGVDVPAEPVAVTTRAPVTARVASWNTLFSNSTGRVLNGLETIAGTADVIGVQELSSPSRRADAARVMAKKGWAVSDGNNAVQIFYNAGKYKLLAQGSEKVIDVVRIESGTAGTSIGPKSVQWVQLQDRGTGGVFFVVNHHLVPDIDRKGHPRPGAPKRLSVYRTQMAAMLSVVTKLRPYGPVAVTGDHNVDARADQKVKNPTFPYMLMRSAGMTSNWSALGAPKAGTQTSGRRLIDYVWLTRSPGRFLAQKILGAYGSDHHAVVAAFASGTTSAAPNTASAVPQPSQAALPASLTVPGWKLDADQIKIAATAIEVGKEFNIPERGWIVAIASGMQESGLRNLAGGDRDSVGWQQQRPSSGWGTVAEIRDIRLATMAFYGVATHTNNRGLTDIDGWQQMTIAEAAQAVQVSAFPSAYAKHEAAARALVSQLAGLVDGTAAPAGDACPDQPADGATGNCPVTALAAEKSLTPDALRVLRCVQQQYPTITDIGGVRADALPDHPSGRAVDLMIPNYQTAAGKAFGWTVARWLQANHRQLGVEYLIFDNKIWNIARDDEGWRTYRADGQGDDSSLHYNHVHVTVFGNKAQPDGPADISAGAWHTPVGQPSSVGCAFGCYSGHTGQDYPAPPGVPVYAVNNGTVTRSESILARGQTCTTLPICGGIRVSYGNLVVIRLAGGGEVTAWYAHLTERRVAVGDTVRTGQVIGTVGYQGNVRPTGPRGSHLHFEIRRGGTPLNPLPYLRSKGIQS